MKDDASAEALLRPRRRRRLLRRAGPEAGSRALLSCSNWRGLEDWWSNPAHRRCSAAPLVRLCALYLTTPGSRGRGGDPVARFHLGNGARLERINWLGNIAPRGLRESFGIMVNYLYDPDSIEANHEVFVRDGYVVRSPSVEALRGRAASAGRQTLPRGSARARLLKTCRSGRARHGRGARYRERGKCVRKEMSETTGPLTGIKVFDLTRVLAGPTCVQMLADLGADVVKIEKPGSGDDTRGFAPPFMPGTKESAYFVGVNRNKRSVTLDISKPEGQAIALELIAQSDILCENFKVGALAKYGLGYEQLHERFPAARLLLDHRLRANRAVCAPPRL